MCFTISKIDNGRESIIRERRETEIKKDDRKKKSPIKLGQKKGLKKRRVIKITNTHS